jgi:hypothetical protein
MKLVKRIFVGSIILLLLITPVLATAEVKQNTNMPTTDTNGLNSLGEVTVIHLPWHYKPLINKGSWMFWNPPKPPYNNLTYYFYEKNNTVKMNFTLTIKHRLNNLSLPFFIIPRYTIIDRLWISSEDGKIDYFIIFNETKCTKAAFETYTINITENMQIQPLETNGQPTNLTLWVLMGVDAGKFNIIFHDGSVWRFGRYLSHKRVISTIITIVPLPAP